jgi:hypothetical protein
VPACGCFLFLLLVSFDCNLYISLSFAIINLPLDYSLFFFKVNNQSHALSMVHGMPYQYFNEYLMFRYLFVNIKEIRALMCDLFKIFYKISTPGQGSIIKHNKRSNFYRTVNIRRLIFGKFPNFRTTEL